MDYRTEQLILRFVTEDDLTEVARTWPSDHHPLSDEEARGAITYMQNNHARNAAGSVIHLCLAVCGAENPGTVMGWCGLDGSRSRTVPELFILLDEEYRGKGYGTQCVKELLRIAAEDFSLAGVHGGCDKDNAASRRVMEKGGMAQYGTEENGDPLFRFPAVSFRPKYHASVPSGWSNDPNGTIFYNGKAHLFFQHYPHKAEWGTMHWGHFTTEDFVRWTVLPPALVPDQPYEVLCGCCSGSAIDKDGKLYLLYTAAQPELQRQCLAVSDDGGITFVKRKDNPILTAQMLDDEVSELDFRDPRLFEKDGVYYFIAGARVLNDEEVALLRSARAERNGDAPQRRASGPVNPSAWHDDRPIRSPSAGDVSGSEPERAGFGNLILCRSADLIRWTYVGHLIHRQPEYDDAYFELNGVYECPDYLELDGKELLLSSPQNLPQMGNLYQNVHSGLWMLGRLDFETGRFRIDRIGEVDSGFDFYAAQTLRMPDGRAILIAWKEMWDRNYPTQAEGWAGTYTFPRELRIEDGQLIQKPARELDRFCKNRISGSLAVGSGDDASVSGVCGSVIRLRFTLEPGTAARAGVRVFAGKEHATVVVYDREAGIVEIDRSRSGLPFRGKEDNVTVRRCEVGSLQALAVELLLDVSTLEVFLDGGKHVMTANVFPDPEDRDVRFFAEGGEAVFRDIEKYDVDPGGSAGL